MKVYLLDHFRNEDELDGFKIIGIFSSQQKAEEAIENLRQKPGFRDYPENFNIGCYEVDQLFWGDGFG